MGDRKKLLLLIYFTVCSFSNAQQVQENLSVELVNVYLSATDKKGQFVANLKPEDLILKENGNVQPITHFTNFALTGGGKLGESDVPLTVAFVVDSSESMLSEVGRVQKIDIVKNAAFRILDEMRDEDRMTFIAFNDIPREITPITKEKKRIETDLLLHAVEGGDTALLDSIYFALEKIKMQFGRKILIVCSDGEDTASDLKMDEVLSNLIASDVTVLAFGTMALGADSLRGRALLEKIAEATGGYAFFPTSVKNLDEVMEKLRMGMRNQYSIGYKPVQTAGHGSWRTIEIQCRREGLKLRYRKGYTR